MIKKTGSEFVSKNDLRKEVSDRLSAMYAKEVPLYGEHVEIDKEVNRQYIANHPELGLSEADVTRVSSERHGAIRLGKPEEMQMIYRIFAIIGMKPVAPDGGYDLTDAGEKSQPVISVAFRPVTLEEIEVSPFRMFTSLLRPDDRRFFTEETSRRIHELIDDRDIFSSRLRELVDLAEKKDGLSRKDADEFISEVTKLFSWAGKAKNQPFYDELVDKKRLNRAIVADIACFPTTHLNHLTPSTLDIDAWHARMKEHLAINHPGKNIKKSIEGPPKRKVPILLRQTSYDALEEPVEFDGNKAATHRARFGEIEQRAVTLTPKGRKLYDLALERAMGTKDKLPIPVDQAFSIIPDDHDKLREMDLAYYTYHVTGKSLPKKHPNDLKALVKAGYIEARPIRYEDFLPVSAAGIFASNLGTGEQGTAKLPGKEHEPSPYTRAEFVKIMGFEILDAFTLYAAQQARSIEEAYKALNTRMPKSLSEDVRRATDADPAARQNGQGK